MKISKKMQEALNKQIKNEFGSGYLYLAMSSYFEQQNYPGMAHWMKLQAKEELAHAMKIYDFVVERQGDVTLLSLEKPKAKWSSPLAAFQEAYNHEVGITAMINQLYNQADKEKDNATKVFLNWFIDEQVEEEASTDEVVQLLKKIRGNEHGLIMLDRQLAKRGSEQ